MYRLIYILVILLSLLPPQDSGTEARTRGGTLNFPAYESIVYFVALMICKIFSI